MNKFNKILDLRKLVPIWSDDRRLGAAVEISEPLLHRDEAEHDKISFIDASDERIPEWKEQITIRGLVVNAVLGMLFCIITHKLNLMIGIIPSLNVATGLLGFFFVKSWPGFSLLPDKRTLLFKHALRLATVSLSAVMVLGYKPTYPSETAMAMLINSFHTNTGAELAKKHVSSLGKYLSISCCWSFFKWFFSGVGDSCGFDNFPSLGLTLFKNT